MAGDLIYAFRIKRLPLLDAGGASIGRIEDIVVTDGDGNQVAGDWQVHLEARLVIGGVE